MSTRLSGADLDLVLRRACADAGLPARTDLPAGVELVRRTGEDAAYLIIINHLDTDVTVPLDGVPHGTELLTGTTCTGSLPVPAGAVRVVRVGPRRSRFG